MSYLGSQAHAYAYDASPERFGYEEEPVRLDVIAGGGLDAAARRSVSATFVRIVRAAALATALFVAFGLVRVAITTQTVGFLDANIDLRSDIAALEQVNSNLKIERSVLSNSTRITRIATQNYGMVLAAGHDRIALPTESMRAHLDAKRAAEAPAADEATAEGMGGTEGFDEARA